MESETITNDYYAYYLDSLTNEPSDTVGGMDTDSLAYQMLYAYDSTTSYFLSTPYKLTRENGVFYGMMGIGNVKVGGDIRIVGRNMYRTSEVQPDIFSYAVRAVVVLEKDVTLTPDGENTWALK